MKITPQLCPTIQAYWTGGTGNIGCLFALLWQLAFCGQSQAVSSLFQCNPSGHGRSPNVPCRHCKYFPQSAGWATYKPTLSSWSPTLQGPPISFRCSVSKVTQLAFCGQSQAPSTAFQCVPGEQDRSPYDPCRHCKYFEQSLECGLYKPVLFSENLKKLNSKIFRQTNF